MNNNDIFEQESYTSLHEIRQRKEQLRKQMNADEEKMKNMWRSLFAQQQQDLSSSSPSKRIFSIMQMGAGAVDGVILGWKLYRKFKKFR